VNSAAAKKKHFEHIISNIKRKGGKKNRNFILNNTSNSKFHITRIVKICSQDLKKNQKNCKILDLKIQIIIFYISNEIFIFTIIHQNNNKQINREQNKKIKSETSQ
jgi:hypothetical protein